MADTSVDWELARQVATKIGDRNSAVSSYHYATLSPDFERFTAQAEELVAETTGLVSQMGNARGRVADRPSSNSRYCVDSPSCYRWIFRQSRTTQVPTKV